MRKSASSLSAIVATPPFMPSSPFNSPTASQIGVSPGFAFASEAANAFCIAPFFLPACLVEDFVGHFRGA